MAQRRTRYRPSSRPQVTARGIWRLSILGHPDGRLILWADVRSELGSRVTRAVSTADDWRAPGLGSEECVADPTDRGSLGWARRSIRSRQTGRSGCPVTFCWSPGSW
jgi:hypothetical protein